LKIEEGELPANYTNMHEKRIKAVLLFRYPAIQLCFWIKRRIGVFVISTIGRDLIGMPGTGMKRGRLPANYTNLREGKLAVGFLRLRR
jgi:hypothetical protein